MAIFLEIPEEVISSTKLTPDEMLLELALTLYSSRRLSSGKASEMAKMPLLQFRQIAASRGIPVDLDVADFHEEVETLKNLGLL